MSRRRHPPDGTELDVAHVPLRAAEVRRERGAALARTKREADRPVVTDNWPTTVPVTHREIDVIETYLGAMLDALLRQSDPHGPRHPER